MTPTITVQIARMRAREPWRSHQSICAQLGKGGAEAKRKKNEAARARRDKLYITWSSKYDNY